MENAMIKCLALCLCLCVRPLARRFHCVPLSVMLDKAKHRKPLALSYAAGGISHLRHDWGGMAGGICVFNVSAGGCLLVI